MFTIIIIPVLFQKMDISNEKATTLDQLSCIQQSAKHACVWNSYFLTKYDFGKMNNLLEVSFEHQTLLKIHWLKSCCLNSYQELVTIG